MRNNHSSSRFGFVIPMVLVLAAAGSACRGEEPAAAAVPVPEQRLDVPAVTASLSDLESTLQISGSLIPQNRVAVMAKLPGTLSRIDAQIGDRVRAGQPVAWLDRREIDAQVDAGAAAVNVARAALEAAEANLSNAVLEHERSQNLFDRGALPRQRLEAAQTANRAAAAQRDLARANLAQAEAALRRAQEVQRDATLTSPIDGVVVERNYDAGSLVSPTDKAVVAVADLRVLKLEAGVSELEAGRLRVGMAAQVSVQARPGETFEGRVATIAPEVDARNRHFRIEVRTANPDGTLLSGMYGVAAIPLQRVGQVVAVPQEAVTSRNGARVVFKIDDGTVREVPVSEGLNDGNLVQISKGLQAGDTIVADARRDLAAGVRVNAVPVRGRQ
jgi:RND family efflux transporter MFP subunit